MVLFALMALTCIDVVGRYFFNSPVAGGLEITEVLMAVIVFSALPLVTLKGEHVMLDLLEPLTPGWMLRLQHVAACLVSALVSGALGWRLMTRAGLMMSYGDTTSVLRLPLHPLTYAMAGLMGVTALVFLIVAFRPPRRFGAAL